VEPSPLSPWKHAYVNGRYHAKQDKGERMAQENIKKTILNKFVKYVLTIGLNMVY